MTHRSHSLKYTPYASVQVLHKHANCFVNVLIALGLLFGSANAFATDLLPKIIDANRSGNSAEANTQRQIDALDDEQRQLFEEYDALSRELASLTSYNTHLQHMLDDQTIQRQKHLQTLENLAETRRQVLPLIIAMTDWLEQLAQAELPFHQEEHHQAIAELRQLLQRGDLDLGSRYQRVLDHYEHALTDGQRVETYTARLGDTEQVVDFLKLGRLALYYQTTDSQHSAYWDATQQQWLALDAKYNDALTRAIRITRKEAAPGLLQLPLKAPAVLPASTRN